ncbi:protein containg helix-turn-helix domain [Longilinea arvoryzae]|uniref:Protein containg helix-turn-helix domain n=1 Tax=Longilinea arvoryzae TaxID=360412 RepID=A0A0S7BHH7_9CHLR|nr:helix-turn-helix transcriptional regulator [Longilinea arvoryzae]GAP15117.1 protein containg helix-turn-helix domain [Longilinea arvoryzae]
MNKNQRLITLRMHKLGVLLYDARLATRRSIEECAEAIGVSPETFKSFEAGVTAPSLPQLEALAFFLDVPIEHFWGNEALSESAANETVNDANRLSQIRNRIIGTRLKLLRTERNFSLEEFSKESSVPIERLSAFEEGRGSLSLPELEVVSLILDIRLESFLDEHGVIGAWRSQQITVQKFMELSERQQQFILQPVNRPYLELAMRLSELSVEKLRGIAEGLLEITY